MAEEAKIKRKREDEGQQQEVEEEESKRSKSYNQILSILETDPEEESNQDLSSLITSLQQELSPTHSDSEKPAADSSSTESPSSSSPDLLRHLLEASDDELGIPQTSDVADTIGVDGGGFNGGDSLPLCGGLWEFEDEAANYYAYLQSELFM